MAYRDSRLDRFLALIDAHGAEIGRWPESDRDWMLGLIETEPEARAAFDSAAELDALLDALPAPCASVSLETAVLQAAERNPARRRWISLWPFAPIWQPALALGCALAFGLAVGATAMKHEPGGEFSELTELAESVSPPPALGEPLE